MSYWGKREKGGKACVKALRSESRPGFSSEIRIGVRWLVSRKALGAGKDREPRAHHVAQGEGNTLMGQWKGVGLEDDVQATGDPWGSAEWGSQRQMWELLQRQNGGRGRLW